MPRIASSRKILAELQFCAYVEERWLGFLNVNESQIEIVGAQLCRGEMGQKIAQWCSSDLM